MEEDKVKQQAEQIIEKINTPKPDDNPEKTDLPEPEKTAV